MVPCQPWRSSQVHRNPGRGILPTTCVYAHTRAFIEPCSCIVTHKQARKHRLPQHRTADVSWPWQANWDLSTPSIDASLFVTRKRTCHHHARRPRPANWQGALVQGAWRAHSKCARTSSCGPHARATPTYMGKNINTLLSCSSPRGGGPLCLSLSLYLSLSLSLPLPLCHVAELRTSRQVVKPSAGANFSIIQ